VHFVVLETDDVSLSNMYIMSDVKNLVPQLMASYQVNIQTRLEIDDVSMDKNADFQVVDSPARAGSKTHAYM
jgi:hypothetical protein